MAVLVLVWGYNWVVMKIALRYAAPFDFAALRTLGASSCLLLTVLLMRPREFRMRYPRGTLLLGLFQTLCFVSLVNLALVHGGAGKSSVLVYSMPFWVALLAPIVLKVHSPRSHWPNHRHGVCRPAVDPVALGKDPGPGQQPAGAGCRAVLGHWR